MSHLPPFGSKERPRPCVTPSVAKMFKKGDVTDELIEWYGYVDFYEYLDDDYWHKFKYNSKSAVITIDDTSTETLDDTGYESLDETSDEGQSSKPNIPAASKSSDVSLAGKYIPLCKRTSSKTIIKSPKAITGVVLGLPCQRTWSSIEEKLRKRPLNNKDGKDKGKGKI